MEKEIALVKTVFKHLNEYKRFRSLHEKELYRGNFLKAKEHELDKYKRIDALELALRGLQSELRNNAPDEEKTESTL